MNNSNISVKKFCILTFNGYYLPGYKGDGPIKTIKNLIVKLLRKTADEIDAGTCELSDEEELKLRNCFKTE